jgi:hypothetical protein
MSWRGVARWVLWSPRRLLLVLLISLVLVVAIGFHARQGSSTQASHARPHTTSVRLAAASPRMHRTSSAKAPQSLPAGAEAAALAFVERWARPGLAEPQWLAALQPLATATYSNALEDEEPWSVTSHRVTGPPSGDGDVRGATVTVPTDAGPVLVTVVHVGASWLVANVQSSP